jgi:hypothetical protein
MQPWVSVSARWGFQTKLADALTWGEPLFAAPNSARMRFGTAHAPSALGEHRRHRLFGGASDWSSLGGFGATPNAPTQKPSHFGTAGFAPTFPAWMRCSRSEESPQMPGSLARNTRMVRSWLVHHIVRSSLRGRLCGWNLPACRDRRCAWRRYCRCLVRGGTVGQGSASKYEAPESGDELCSRLFRSEALQQQRIAWGRYSVAPRGFSLGSANKSGTGRSVWRGPKG